MPIEPAILKVKDRIIGTVKETDRSLAWHKYIYKVNEIIRDYDDVNDYKMLLEQIDCLDPEELHYNGSIYDARSYQLIDFDFYNPDNRTTLSKFINDIYEKEKKNVNKKQRSKIR